MRTQDECRWKYEVLVILAFVERGSTVDIPIIAVFVSSERGIDGPFV